MGTFIVLVILVLIVGLVIRSMIKDKKAGKSLQCGVNCQHCNGSCHEDLKKHIDQLRKEAEYKKA